MIAAAVAPALVRVREARPDDNVALKSIAAASAMRGDIALCVTREPDFFALSAVEGDNTRLAVAEVDGTVAGCVLLTERASYIHGRPARTLYTGDLKVHPSFRGVGVANALSQWTYAAAAALGDADIPVLLTILGGNRAMERRTEGRGGVPRFSQFATIRALSIPLFLPHRVFAPPGVRVARARAGDIDEMVALWARVAPGRQFAPQLDAGALSRWVTNAQSLSLDDYHVARNADGSIAGFVAWWDQAAFKQMRVEQYTPRLRVVRSVINTAAYVTSTPALPPEGGVLRFRSAFHLCVPPGAPDVLRALVTYAGAEFRAREYAFITIGLDIRDPLRAGVTRLFAQPTDIGAYVCTPGGTYAGPPLDDRPLHYETALV